MHCAAKCVHGQTIENSAVNLCQFSPKSVAINKNCEWKLREAKQQSPVHTEGAIVIRDMRTDRR